MLVPHLGVLDVLLGWLAVGGSPRVFLHEPRHDAGGPLLAVVVVELRRVLGLYFLQLGLQGLIVVVDGQQHQVHPLAGYNPHFRTGLEVH